MSGPITEPRYDAAGRPRVPLLPRDSLGLALSLVFLLGFLLRMVDLGGQSLWIDELLTLRQGRVEGFSLWTQFLDDAQAALPMALATMMSRLAEDEFWLRLPSALLGALSIPLMFEVARRFVTDRAALIAALLLAIHPMHIDHSQEIRGYAFMVFFGLAATLVVLDGGRRPGVRQVIMLVVCGVAAGLSNLQGLVWMGGLALGIAFSGRIRLRDAVHWALPFILIVGLLSPWWLTTFEVHETGRLVPGMATGEDLRADTTWTPWALPWAGLVLSFGKTIGPTVPELHAADVRAPATIALASAAALVVLVLVVAGLRRMGRRAVEPLLWCVPVLVISVVLAVRNVKPFNPRYIIAVLPALLIIVAAGLDGIRVRRAQLLMAAWIALTGVSLGRYYFDPDYRQVDVRQAARLVAERRGSDDVVLVPTVKMVFDFYDRGLVPTRTIQPGELAPGVDPGPFLNARVEPHRYVWYVRARSWVHDPRGQLDPWMEEHWRRISRTELGGAVVTLYDRGADGSD
jgi:mannosyltransferase